MMNEPHYQVTEGTLDALRDVRGELQGQRHATHHERAAILDRMKALEEARVEDARMITHAVASIDENNVLLRQVRALLTSLSSPQAPSTRLSSRSAQPQQELLRVPSNVGASASTGIQQSALHNRSSVSSRPGANTGLHHRMLHSPSGSVYPPLEDDERRAMEDEEDQLMEEAPDSPK
jgi:hypothetical protein